MKKYLHLFVVATFFVGVFSISEMIKAQDGIESNYRPPVISPLPSDLNYPFLITRIECVEDRSDPDNIIPGHSGTPGSRYMDISLVGETDNGVPIYASGAGEVVVSTETGGLFGQTVVTENDEVGFRYAHLSKIYVNEGQRVEQGDLVGLIGTSGYSFGSHLHWEAWQINNSGFDLMKIPGINLENSTAGLPCVDENAGTITGESIHIWDSCPEFFQVRFPVVALFDHKECRGNLVIAKGLGTYNLADQFNDRTRSIYIPPGKSVVVGANVDDPMGLHLCHSVDMWNVDEDTYANSTVKLGWQGYEYPNGYNMISSITVLDNPNCEFDGQVISTAAPGILPDTRVSAYTENIEPEVHIDPNSPYGQALEKILEAEASGASNLDLSNMELTQLPPEIGRLKNLKTLYLQHNQLKSLPQELWSLTNLEDLCLWQNHISVLPPEIGLLTNLVYLDLNSTGLDELPPEIGNLVNLKGLSLVWNQLETLPPEIGNLVNLEDLQLGQNKLTELPAELGNLVNLESWGLGLMDNPLIDPPPQIVAQGVDEILEYLRKKQ